MVSQKMICLSFRRILELGTRWVLCPLFHAIPGELSIVSPCMDELTPLDTALATVIDDCTECGNCVDQCAYLQRFGTPLAQARSFEAGSLTPETIYSCNVCSLCDVFCPEGLKLSEMFWLMRCRLVEEGRGPLKSHRRILNYEKIGLSDLFQLTAIPEGSEMVFFPGCALAGTRPQQTVRLFEMLRKDIPNLGIVLNCCTKPSHDLGRKDFFGDRFGDLINDLKNSSIKTIVTACPSCHQIFSRYAEDFENKTIYEVLAEHPSLTKIDQPLEMAVHDPCATRFDSTVQQSVRDLGRAMGCTTVEMKHGRKKTFCCGEGGSASFVAPDLTKTWGEKRRDEAGKKPVLTYCAGCVQFLSGPMDIYHIIDLLLEPEKTLAGKAPVSRSPFTYLNRLRLKYKLRRGHNT